MALQWQLIPARKNSPARKQRLSTTTHQRMLIRPDPERLTSQFVQRITKQFLLGHTKLDALCSQRCFTRAHTSQLGHGQYIHCESRSCISNVFKHDVLCSSVFVGMWQGGTPGSHFSSFAAVIVIEGCLLKSLHFSPGSLHRQDLDHCRL